MKGYINIVFQNNDIYECSDELVRKFFRKGNCYYISYRNDLDQPCYEGKNIDMKNKFIIGDESKLVEFCAKCSGNKTIVIDGIAREEGLKIFSLIKQKNKCLVEDLNDTKKMLGYETKAYYSADELIIGGLVYANQDFVEGIVMEQRYLFERILVGSVVKYIEIFSGLIVDEKRIEFGRSHINDAQCFVDIFPLSKGEEISKDDLKLYLEGINYKYNKNNKKGFFSRIRKK